MCVSLTACKGKRSNSEITDDVTIADDKCTHAPGSTQESNEASNNAYDNTEHGTNIAEPTTIVPEIAIEPDATSTSDPTTSTTTVSEEPPITDGETANENSGETIPEETDGCDETEAPDNSNDMGIF